MPETDLPNSNLDKTHLDTNGLATFGKAIEKQRLNAGVKQESIALELGIDPRTYRKIKSGEHRSLSLYKQVADFLGLDSKAVIDQIKSANFGFAPTDLGGYHKSSVSHLVGHYGLYRRSYTLADKLFFLVIEIAWSDEQSCLVFNESHTYSIDGLKSVDHSQTGKVSISSMTGQLHFITAEQGSVRLMTTTAPLQRRGRQRMNGGVFTQVESMSGFQPAFTAIYLEKLTDEEVKTCIANIGPIASDHKDYDLIRSEIEQIENQLLINPK